jgi:ribonuclease T1
MRFDDAAPAASGWSALRRAALSAGGSLVVALGVLVVALGSLHASWSSAGGQAFAADAASGIVRDAEVPQKAWDVLAEIQRRNGEPPPGYVGGRTFGNREHRLPRGRYREYDVNPKKPGRSRGTERIVIEERTGKAYYSGDHYETFVPMN